MWRMPALRASFELGVMPSHKTESGFEEFWGSAGVRVHSGLIDELPNAREVVSTSLKWGGPLCADEGLHGALRDLKPDGSDWILEFDRLKVSRDFQDADFEMRLVCNVLRHFSHGRSCVAVVCVEPRYWQSLKVDDRETQRRALKHYWSRLGFDTSLGERHVARRVHDFQIPSPLRSWGPDDRPGL